MNELKSWVLRKQTAFWNWVSFFPKMKVRSLEKKLSTVEAELDAEADKVIDRIVDRYKRSERFKKKARENYIAWKAVQRKILIDRIGCCEKCGSKSRVLTADHILPVRFLKDMGIREQDDLNPDNLQLLCQLCNSNKSNNFDFTNPKTYYLLVEYLEKLPKQPNPFKKKKKVNLKGTPYDPDLI